MLCYIGKCWVVPLSSCYELIRKGELGLLWQMKIKPSGSWMNSQEMSHTSIWTCFPSLSLTLCTGSFLHHFYPLYAYSLLICFISQFLWTVSCIAALVLKVLAPAPFYFLLNCLFPEGNTGLSYTVISHSFLSSLLSALPSGPATNGDY